METKVVLVDLDGTLADYSEGWQGDEVIGNPLPSSKELLKGLKDRGFRVVIYTTRTGPGPENRSPEECEHAWRLVWRWLSMHGLDRFVDEVFEGDKPIASFLVDDRAIRFGGKVGQVLDDIDNYEEWWKRGEDSLGTGRL